MLLLSYLSNVGMGGGSAPVVVSVVPDAALPGLGGGGDPGRAQRPFRPSGKRRYVDRSPGLGSTYEAPRILIRNKNLELIDPATGMTPDEEEMAMILMAIHEVTQH